MFTCDRTRLPSLILFHVALIGLGGAPDLCWSAPHEECQVVAGYVAQTLGSNVAAIEPTLSRAPAVSADWYFFKSVKGGPFDTADMRNLLARAQADGDSSPDVDCSAEFLTAGLPLATGSALTDRTRYGFSRVLVSKQRRFALFAYGYSMKWGQGVGGGAGAVVLERKDSAWRIIADSPYGPWI